MSGGLMYIGRNSTTTLGNICDAIEIVPLGKHICTLTRTDLPTKFIGQCLQNKISSACQL